MIPRIAAATLLLGLAPSLALAEIDAKKFKKDFTATQNSWERRALVTQLDPSDDKSLDLLLKFVLKTQDWYMREAAVDVLATTFDAFQ